MTLQQQTADPYASLNNNKIIIIITVFIKRQIAKGYKALRRNEEGKRQNKEKDDQLRRGKKVGFESTFEGWDTV